MTLKGHCYCGQLKYEVEGALITKGNCHCRECQYISGGHPNAFIVMPDGEFKYTEGSPKSFKRADLEQPRTREFCGTCGTHILTKSDLRPGAVIIKVGTLDNPAIFDKPDMAIFTVDIQPYHRLDPETPSYERMKT